METPKCKCGAWVVVDYADGMCTICCIKKLKAENKKLKGEVRSRQSMRQV